MAPPSSVDTNSGVYSPPACNILPWSFSRFLLIQARGKSRTHLRMRPFKGGIGVMKRKVQEDFAERVRVNQQKLSSELRTRFDYIVCGAGTSGCVVAARLAADMKTQVLLLEAGGADETELITNPNRWPMTLGSELDWGFVAEPNPHLNGRAIPYSMGKVLGGGSSINVSTWSRGHRADWDFYAAESGDPSWGYEAVLDLYRRRIEAWTGNPDPDYRGTRGI